MKIGTLTLHDFRNYSDLHFTPDARRNVLLGKNAQGKTSILEAIYLLATARSWRTGKDAELIHWSAEGTRVFAKVQREEQNDVDIEIVVGRTGKKRISVNTITQNKLADFLGQVNVVLIEPHDVDIVRGDPSMRRRFLNLEISQIQPQYCHLMSNYRRVLEQRNRLLRELDRRNSGDGLLEVLNEQLVNYGSKIMARRLNFVDHISDLARVLHSRITEEAEQLKVEYVSSINIEGTENRAEILAERIRARLDELHDAEIHRGVTLAGPQRDDLLFTVNDIDARIYGSQGQQRTIALSLRLAELEIMEEASGEPPIVLLDDVMTDLDEDRRAHVFQMTQGRCQTFITGASRRAFDEDFLSEGKVFHVAEGKVTEE